jgi:membrane protease YdiL (CAAX protease family)
MRSNTTVYKILHTPLTKIIIGVGVVAGIYGLSQYLLTELLKTVSFSNDLEKLVAGIVSAILSIIAYTYLFTFYEKRKITELSVRKLGRNLIPGVIIGIVLQSLTILVIYLKGGYSIITVNDIVFIIPAATMAFSSAIFEELLFRGIMFRIIEEKSGTFIALIFSAFIFGLLHLANPNSSFIVAIGLAIQAGLLLATAYVYTRNLWFPIAIHFAWNFTQSGIYGAIVSGNSSGKSLLTSEIQGAKWFTGGQFGPEGSIQATLFCLIATIILLALCIKQKKIIAPYWKPKTTL